MPVKKRFRYINLRLKKTAQKESEGVRVFERESERSSFYVCVPRSDVAAINK